MVELSSKDRIESFQQLADSADKRIQQRLAIEWKLCVATWITLGAGGGLIAGRGSALLVWQAIALAGLGLLASVVCARVVLWIQRANAFDEHQANSLSCAMENALGCRVPADLRPPEGTSPWPRFSEADTASSPDGKGTRTGREESAWWTTWRHGVRDRPTLAKLLITLLFLALFLIVVFGRLETP